MNGFIKFTALFLLFLAIATTGSSLISNWLDLNGGMAFIVGCAFGIPCGVIPVRIAVARDWIFS